MSTTTGDGPVSAAQASYEARQRSFWARHGMQDGDPLPAPWDRLTAEQRADEEAGALALTARAEPRGGLAPVVMGVEELVAVIEDILGRVGEGDSFEGHIEWMIPDDPDAPPRSFEVRAAYRTGNTMGQGGMRMIGTLPGQHPNPRCTDFCRAGDPSSPGHPVTTREELSAMKTVRIPAGCTSVESLVHLLYQAGFGYHAAADYAGISHERACRIVSGG